MQELVSGVYRLEGVRGANVYAVLGAEGAVVIDAGNPGAADRILAELAQVGIAPRDLRAVVLTHAHIDHIGGAAQLAAQTGAEVLAHRAEVPLIEGTAAMPARSFLQRVMGAAQRAMRGRAVTVTRALEDGEVLEDLGGLRVLHTPGHTPGSICLYRTGGDTGLEGGNRSQSGDRPGGGNRSQRGILFAGDLLFNGHPVTGRGGLQIALPMISVDPAQARQSVRRLLDLPIAVLCCGHGAPITEGVRERLRALVAEPA